MAPERRQYSDPAQTLDLDAPGAIEDLVIQRRAPIFVEYEDNPIRYVHIPPAGTKLRDRFYPTPTGEYEVYNFKTGKRRGLTIKRAVVSKQRFDALKERRKRKLLVIEAQHKAAKTHEEI